MAKKETETFVINYDSNIDEFEKSTQRYEKVLNETEGLAKDHVKYLENITQKSQDLLSKHSVKALKYVLPKEQFAEVEKLTKRLVKGMTSIKIGDTKSNKRLEADIQKLNSILEQNEDKIDILNDNIKSQDELNELLKSENTLYTDQLESILDIKKQNDSNGRSILKNNKELQSIRTELTQLLEKEQLSTEEKERQNELLKQEEKLTKRMGKLNDKQGKISEKLEKAKLALGNRDKKSLKEKVKLKATELMLSGKSRSEAYKIARAELGAKNFLEKSKEKLEKARAIGSSAIGSVKDKVGKIKESKIGKGAAEIGSKTAGSLGLGGMLGLGAAGLGAAFIGAMISAEKQIKAARREIFKMAAGTGEVGISWKNISTNVEKYRQATMQYVESFGLSIDEARAGFGALTAQGFKLKEITAGDTFANFYTQSILTGQSMDELAATAGQLRMEFGKTADKSSETFSMFRKQVEGTSLTTSVFFDKVMNASTGLAIYGDRIAKTSALISSMAKFATKSKISVAAVTDVTEKLSRGFMDMTSDKQLAILKLAGSNKTLEQARDTNVTSPQDQAILQIHALQTALQKSDFFKGLDLKDALAKISDTKYSVDDRNKMLLAFDSIGETVAGFSREQMKTIKEITANLKPGKKLEDIIKESEAKAKKDAGLAASKAEKEREAQLAKDAQLSTRPLTESIEQNVTLWLQKIFAVIEPGLDFVKKILRKGFMSLLKVLSKVSKSAEETYNEMIASDRLDDVINRLTEQKTIEENANDEIIRLNERMIGATEDEKKVLQKRINEQTTIRDSASTYRKKLEAEQSIYGGKNKDKYTQYIDKLTELQKKQYTLTKAEVQLQANNKGMTVDKLVKSDNSNEGFVGAYKRMKPLEDEMLKLRKELEKSTGYKFNDDGSIGGKVKVEVEPKTKLAKGGVVNKPIVASIGEENAEAVTPLDSLQGFISKAVDSALINGGLKGSEKALTKLAKAAPIAGKAGKAVPGVGIGMAIKDAISAGMEVGSRMPGASDSGKQIIPGLLKGLGSVLSVAGAPGAAAQVALNEMADQRENKYNENQKATDWARSQINDNKTVNIFVNHKEAEHIKQVVREEMYAGTR